MSANMASRRWTSIPTRLVALLVLAFVLGLGTAQAQAPNATLAQSQSAKITEIVTRVDGLAAGVDKIATDDAKLVEVRIQAEQAERDLLAASLAFQPRLTEISTRLDQLGAPPADGQPAEPEAVTAERNRLLGEKAEINELIGKAETGSITANQLVGKVNDIRRDLFSRALYTRTPVTLESMAEARTAFANEVSLFKRRVTSWWNFTARFKYGALTIATGITQAIILLFYSVGRRLFYRLTWRDPAEEHPSYLARLSTAIWSVLVTSLSIVVFILTALATFDLSRVISEPILDLFDGFFSLILIVLFVRALATAILSPGNPAWSLVPIGEKPARRIRALIVGIAAVSGLDFWLNNVSEILDSPVSVSVLKAIVSTIAVGILIALLGKVKPFTDEDGNPRPWPTWFRYSLFAVGLVPIGAALFGYVGFARFVLEQIVLSGGILVTMYLGYLSSQALSQEEAFAKTSLGQRLERTGRFDHATLDQMSIAFSVIINVLILAIGLSLILLQWGFQLQDIVNWVYRAATEIRIGSVSISLFGILTGIAVFFIACFATRWFQGWLDNSVLKRGKFDTGVRNSIRTAVGYLGIGLAVLVGISVAGINLSNLALVAGALSLGIGFGLQNIVSNFVSGLILLAERPFKEGDWIVAGAHVGLVKKISVRATEIETFQRQTIILPNSELINQPVGNWTHKNRLGRVDIAVGVSYDSDPVMIRDFLMDIARNNKLVLRNPEPQVVFTNFGASSLDFELRVFLADIFNSAIVQTELRMEIYKRMKEEGIEIPFPQTDLHIKSGSPDDVRRFVQAVRPAQEAPVADGTKDQEETSAAQDKPVPVKPRRKRENPE